MSENDTELRRRIALGLAYRYTIRARAEGEEFIVEGIEVPTRLRGFNGEAGAGRRSGIDASFGVQAVLDRMHLELKVIQQAGLAAYIVFVADCVRYGRSIGAVGVAIGSGPGSLICYLLGISNVDPLRHGLLFERFLNPDRVMVKYLLAMPDVGPICHGLVFEPTWDPARAYPHAIYLDFADDRLDAVIEYVRKTSGSSPVAHLVTDLKSDPPADLPTLGLLGQKALTILRRTCERVRQTNGLEVSLDQLPLDDAKTYDLLKNGDTSGIFELESGGMRAQCRNLYVSSFEHITALVALYRPGLMDRIPDFIKRRHGKVAIEYGHPLLESISKETGGMLIYQEQLMQAAQILAGYTLGGADLLRRAMGKRKAEELAQHRKYFVKGAQERNSIPATKANQLFDWMVELAGYGFNKSHAVAYAMVAYQTAYLKANHPVEFLSAMTQTDGDAELRDDQTPGKLSP